MPGPVERWLETFMCKQYAEIFDAYGFKTLQLVCQLQIQHLQSMGIPQEHCELIYQNVQVLRQSMSVSMQHQQYGDEMRGHYGSRMSQRTQEVAYQGRESSQQQGAGMNMAYNSHMSGSSNFGNQRSMMMSQQFSNQGSSMYSQQQPEQPFMNPAYRQQYPTPNYSSPRQTTDGVYPSTGAVTSVSASTNSSIYNSRHPQYTGQVQGAASMGQASMQQSHPHLRTISQNPQEVANNILHIASSSYPSNQTVQVPLSKNRSAPYHVPPRSPHYTMQPDGPQQHMGSSSSCYSQGQFMYPSSSPHLQQPQHQPQHARMSPISPASGVLPSPHSHHSGHSIPSSSPRSVHSPGIGNMKSPASDINRGMMRTPPSGPGSQQQMNSPLRGQQQYQMSSPTNTPHQRMVSPVPVNQQLQVSVQSQSQQMYRDNMSVISPAGSHSQSQSSVYFSSNPHNSPGGQSGHFSNISSPYTPGSRASLPSPNQPYSQTPLSGQYLNAEPIPHVDTGGNCRNSSASNPLMSLQKLCMLPERQVVDPKSVVNDACTPSPQNNECPKNFHANADSQDSKFGNYGRQSESASSCVPEGIDGKLCNIPLEDNKPAANTARVIQENTDRNEVSNPEHMEEKNMVKVGAENTEANANTASVIQTRDMGSSEVDKTANGSPCGGEGSNNTSVQSGAESLNNKQSVQAKSVNVSPEKSNQEKLENTDKELPAGTSRLHETEEVKCQPKKMMLLRATKGQFNTTASHDQPESTSSGAADDKTTESDLCPTENVDEQKESNNDTLEVENKGETHSSHQDSLKDETEMNNSSCKTESKESIQNENETVRSASIGSGLYDISDSEDESHLIVRKDIKTTYSKHDRLKKIDLTSRIRGHSTGSLSDNLENSDMEYEDHIGCDDIENDLSYCDEKLDAEVVEDTQETDNVLVKVINPLKNESKKVTMNTDKVVISSPHWKKSKLNNLQSVHHNPHIGNSVGKKSEKRLANGAKNRRKKVTKKAVKRVKEVSEVVDVVWDEMIPSPTGRDMVSAGMDNGDGTMSVARSTRLNHRLRKTPLKYKDTSFFQGDFVFVEEEEEEDFYELKRRSSKKNSTDVNHNTKKTEELKKKEKVIKKDIEEIDKVGTGKKELLKEKKQKQNLNTKSSQKKIYYNVINGADNVTNDEKGTECVVITSEKLETEQLLDGNEKKDKLISPKKETKIKAENLSKENESDHASKSAKKETSKRTRTSSKVKQSVKSNTESTVTTRNTSLAVTNKDSSSNSDNEKKKKQPLNGVKKIDKDKSQGGDLKSKPEQEVELIKEEETDVKEGVAEFYVIEENLSDDLNEACMAYASKSAEISGGKDHTLFVKDQEISVDLTCEDSEVENSRDSVDGAVKTEIKEEIKVEIKSELLTDRKVRGKMGQHVKKRKPSSGSKTSDVNKKSSGKKKSASRNKRKTFDCDSDYELGPKKKSLKSMNLNRTQDLMNSKKKIKPRDKWAHFKGPMVRLEGSKEAPEKCIVINEPYEQSGLKNTKLTMQNVSSIQISHLPSDKSVLIPHNDAEEGSKWECALCGKHSSYKFLGDLFGPYTVESLSDDMDGNFHSKSSSKKRRSEEPQPGTSKSSRSSKRVVTVNKEATMWKEVWVHESCGVWSDGVFLIGTKIYGLQEAVRIASQTPCTRCHEMGAMIGCLNKGCQQKFHHACAVDSDCYLDEENFSLLCSKHKVKKLKQLESSSAFTPS